jgi:hypothetical protein
MRMNGSKGSEGVVGRANGGLAWPEEQCSMQGVQVAQQSRAGKGAAPAVG